MDIYEVSNNVETRISLDIYWLCCAVVFSSGLYCILLTLLCNIFGNGLALRGPVGSIIRAVDGLVEQQGGVMRSFVVTVIFFGLSLVSYFWAVMTVTAAILCTSLYLLASILCYIFCVRIYNRFKLTEDDKSTLWVENSASSHLAGYSHGPFSPGENEGRAGPGSRDRSFDAMSPGFENIGANSASPQRMVICINLIFMSLNTARF